MTTRLAGHLLAECLDAQGVTHAFGMPGESFLAVLDGFYLHAERICFITNRQEGGAAFMAEAQGKLTGRPVVRFVTRGPGATNTSLGMHAAFQDSTPMVLRGRCGQRRARPRGVPRSRLCRLFRSDGKRHGPSGSHASTMCAASPNSWRGPLPPA